MRTVEALAVAAEALAGDNGETKWPVSWGYAFLGDLVAVGTNADVAAAAVEWEESIGDDGSAP